MNLEIGKDQAFYVEALSGSASVLGLENDDVTIKYAGPDDAVFTTYEIAASGWTELGEGVYFADFNSSLVGTVTGTFAYVVKPSGATDFDTYRNAVGLVEQPPHEVFVSAAYNEETLTLTAQIWMHKNGQLVTDPDTAYVEIYAAGGIASPILSSAATGPNADGVFILTETPSLVANTNYFVKARVTRDSADYWSGESIISVD